MAERRIRLLFICHSAENRSPTAAEMYYGKYNTFAIGVYSHDNQEIEDRLKWCDYAFVMEEELYDVLYNHFPELCDDKNLKCLDIPDYYDRNELALKQLIDEKMAQYLDAIDTVARSKKIVNAYTDILKSRIVKYPNKEHTIWGWCAVCGDSMYDDEWYQMKNPINKYGDELLCCDAYPVHPRCFEVPYINPNRKTCDTCAYGKFQRILYRSRRRNMLGKMYQRFVVCSNPNCKHYNEHVSTTCILWEKR